MTEAMAGRMIAAVGVVLGFVAIWLDYVSADGFSEKYSDDGTVLAYLLATLILTAVLLAAAAIGRMDVDALAAVTGSAAFGFYLFAPAAFGFNHFDVVATGGWLGICTILIPLGMAYTLYSRRTAVTPPAPAALIPVLVGRILCLVAIWLEALDGGSSYWNFADKGRALPAAMLLLVIGGAALGAGTGVWRTRTTVDGALILAAVTFGLYEALLIGNAFDGFGRLGAGAWLGSAGALVLLLGAAYLWNLATRGAAAAPPAPAVEPPAA